MHKIASHTVLIIIILHSSTPVFVIILHNKSLDCKATKPTRKTKKQKPGYSFGLILFVEILII